MKTNPIEGGLWFYETAGGGLHDISSTKHSTSLPANWTSESEMRSQLQDMKRKEKKKWEPFNGQLMGHYAK